VQYRNDDTGLCEYTGPIGDKVYITFKGEGEFGKPSKGSVTIIFARVKLRTLRAVANMRPINCVLPLREHFKVTLTRNGIGKFPELNVSINLKINIKGRDKRFRNGSAFFVFFHYFSRGL
jgi:hypothetical protein